MIDSGAKGYNKVIKMHGALCIYLCHLVQHHGVECH